MWSGSPVGATYRCQPAPEPVRTLGPPNGTAPACAVRNRWRLRRFLAEHAGAVPIGGPRVRTGSGAGWHLYVAPTGLPDHIGVLEGVDYRAAGRYVAAPPSRHSATGRPYVWNAGRGLDTPLGQVPPALRERLAPRPIDRQPEPAPTVRPAEPGHPYGRAVLEAETARIAGAHGP